MSRKKTIPKPLRDAVWDFHAGELSGTVECFACGKILKRSDYECGHVISAANEGKLEVPNLRPIHGTCNKSMGSRNLMEFREEMIKCKVFEVNKKLNVGKVSMHILYNSNISSMAADKKKDIQLPPELEFMKEFTVDELKEWCEVYGTKKGKSKTEIINNIISAPGFKADQLLRMTPLKGKLLQLKLPILSKICEDIGETKKGTKKELTIRILRKNPNIDITKYINSEEQSNREQEDQSVTEEEFKKMVDQAVKLSLEGNQQPGAQEKCKCLCDKCNDRVKKLEDLVQKLASELSRVKNLIGADG